MLLGGQLVARHIRLPYAASATLLGLLVPLVFLFFRETLTPEQRVPFRWRPPGLGFVRLFSSGPELRGLSAVHALQTLSIAMGDTWQVFSRELRGWGASECGLFGSLSGAGAMVAALLSRRSVRTSDPNPNPNPSPNPNPNPNPNPRRARGLTSYEDRAARTDGWPARQRRAGLRACSIVVRVARVVLI